MDFLRYPSLSKLGHDEVEGIVIGQTYIMPKIDGTNGSLWVDWSDEIGHWVLHAGSRNRELSLDNDNAGFFQAMSGPEGLPYYQYLCKNPDHILYGEWLVPHSLKNYRDDAWRKFYVFDIYDASSECFIPYEYYEHTLKNYPGLHYIPVYKIAKNPSTDELWRISKDIKYLLKEEHHIGEGIVIKNYHWSNKFKRQVWAKLVNAEFKEKHVLEMGASESGGECNEEKIVKHAVTEALIEKEYAKIVLDQGGWSNKCIPRLLETVFYCLVKEELWDALKVINYGSINFKALKTFTIMKIKEVKPELFGLAKRDAGGVRL